MDLKIKKENSPEKKLVLPKVANAEEAKKHEADVIVEPEDKGTLRIKRQKEELILTTHQITTEFNSEDFDTLKVNTQDLELEIEKLERERENTVEFDRHADTIKVKKAESDNEPEDNGIIVEDDSKESKKVKVKRKLKAASNKARPSTSKPKQPQKESSKEELSSFAVFATNVKRKLRKMKNQSSKRGKKSSGNKPVDIDIRLVYAIIAFIILAAILGGYGYYTTHHYSESKFVETSLENSSMVKDIYTYGESITLEGLKVSDLQAYNRDTQEYTKLNYGKTIDDHLFVNSLVEGNYFLFNGGNIVTMDSNPKMTFNTITRDGVSKKVSITTDENKVLNLGIKDGATDTTDILIDPSQGYIQGFTASDNKTTEQQLSLSIAKKLQTELKALGYNAQLTREDDSVPGDCDYQDTYCAEGRVGMPYSSEAKIYISIGFNGTGGSGYEITDSVNSSHNLAKGLSKNLSTVLEPSSRQTDQISNGVYNTTYKAKDGTVEDYLYLIRETGGVAMNSDNAKAKELHNNKMGAQTVVADLGYMSESADFNKLKTDANQTAIAKAMATAIDQYIKGIK